MKKTIILCVVAAALVAAIIGFWSKWRSTVKENERLQNNIEFYSNTEAQNIVLRSTVKELRESKDSLIQKVDSVQKLLALKPKETKVIVYQETVIRDTIRDTIPMTFNFEKIVRPNDQTTIEVIRKDSLLTVIPDIRNEQTLFIQGETSYVYKGFFRRLIHFNFKKKTVGKYYIDNSNDLIQVENTRVVEVEK